MPSKDEVAKMLAAKHYSFEAGISRIFRITRSRDAEAKPVEPSKLLEVNAHTIPAGVMPLHFGPVPASGIPYPTVIIEVTPEEFDRIQAQELKLPDGWVIGEELARPAAANGSE
jgi:hypothetical protein